LRAADVQGRQFRGNLNKTVIPTAPEEAVVNDLAGIGGNRTVDSLKWSVAVVDDVE
jgi:hypothetical protein